MSKGSKEMYITYTVYGNTSHIMVAENSYPNNLEFKVSDCYWIVPGTIAQ